MRVLVVPDKFKGTLTAQEAAAAIASGWRQIRPADQLDLLPMSDGGDGFGEILGQLFGAERQFSSTVNAAHEPIEAEWWWSESLQIAVVESAKVIGLAMLPSGKFHPFELDTQGLGRLIRHIVLRHANARLVIGIGGSATNDAGFGMALGLGFRFRDATGHCIDRWLEASRLFQIEPLRDPISISEVTIASDVQNPLLGHEGASRIYGPQKGLRPEDFSIADRCFERLTDVVQKDLGLDCADEPGTGAAGGLGYGLKVFLNGRFEPGFNIFARAARLEERISAADLVLTGEGAIDQQTKMGKGTGAVANLARGAGKPCIGLAGHLPDKIEGGLFEFVLGISPRLTSTEEAKRNPAAWLEKLAAEAARQNL